MISGMCLLNRVTRLLAFRLATGVLLCLLPLMARAEAPLLVLSDFSPSYNQVRDAIMTTVQEQPNVVTLDQLSTHHSRTGIIIAVGSRACEQMLSRYHPNTHLICTFLPSTTFAMLQRNLLPEQEHSRISAIFIDQPLSRQVQLARLVKPEAHTLGSALGSNSRALQRELETGSRLENFQLQLAHLSTQDNPVEKLTPVIAHSDIFLVIPDSSVFNRAISKWLLYLSLRHQVPVIGFSESYTEAGAAASVHSSATQIGLQTGEWLNRLQKGNDLPSPSYPAYFNVSTNPVAARTLHLELPPAEALEQQLLRGEAINE